MSPAQDAPVCVFCRRKPVDPPWRPFCSSRCKLQDLAQWADERYRVPVDREDPERLSDDSAPPESPEFTSD